MSALTLETAAMSIRETQSADDRLAQANALKDEGNGYLSSGHFAMAANKYSMAIEILPTAIFFSNRAQALIKLESYGLAISDANEAIKLDPRYLKAYYRRGSANYALGKMKAALKDFKAVLAIAPKDPDAQARVKVCEKMIREDAFQKAIEFDAPADPVINIEAITVEDSYTGPRLDLVTPEVTLDFVHECMETFKAEKKVHKRFVLQVLQQSLEHLRRQSSLLRLSLPRNPENNEVCGTLTVCGDTHGQYYDLLHLFELAGEPSANNRFLFNGDFVDRGSFSFENVFVLLALQLAVPQGLHLLRGNHETKNMNKIYGFEGEVLFKYDTAVMKLFSRLFQALPLAAVLEDKVFVVHGGISTANEGQVSLSEIESIARFSEPPESGLMSDLLWSDPQPQVGRAASKRGLGFSFGPDFTRRFLSHNGLKLLIRSHEVREEGYEVEHDGQCITVFSAPNYCDQMGNKGAFVRFSETSEMKPQFTQFTHVPHPNVPPMRYAGNMFSL